jgi:hypothetical protein
VQINGHQHKYLGWTSTQILRVDIDTKYTMDIDTNTEGAHRHKVVSIDVVEINTNTCYGAVLRAKGIRWSRETTVKHLVFRPYAIPRVSVRSNIPLHPLQMLCNGRRISSPQGQPTRRCTHPSPKNSHPRSPTPSICWGHFERRMRSE